MNDYWQKIEEAVFLAPEIPAAEYESWLDKFCEGDNKLKAEIESLLSIQTHSEKFLEKVVDDYVAQIFSEDESDFSTKDFGHYKIIREIGAGGMGTVFLAERSDGEFNQQVALKIVRHRFAGADVSKRFRRERQILANLNHPNIARLLDGGINAEGESFIVMEYVEGERIDEYCNKNNLSLIERLKLYLSVCAAVACAHQNLVVHRDIKPSNIIVARDGTPKLLDFGIAKLLDAENTDEQTQTGLRAFTPEYASPEQKIGGQITTATDIYSLGVLLSNLLGRKFTNSNETTNRKIEPELKAILQMAQREEPERRYASVQQFSEDIERYLNGLPVRAQKGSFTYFVGKFIRRNRIVVSAAAIILLSLIVGLTVSLWQYRNAEQQRVKAEKINGFLEKMISSSNPLNQRNPRQNSSAEFASVLEEASRQVEDEDFDSEPTTKANLQQIIGANYLSIGKYDLAEQKLRAALTTQSKLLGENHPDTLKTLVALGQIALIRSNYVEAKDINSRILDSLRRESGRGNIDKVYLRTALHNFALSCRAFGDTKRAEALLREAIAMDPETNGNQNDQTIISETVLTLTLADQGKFDEAEERVKTQIDKLKKDSKTETPEMCSALTMIGSIKMEKGETTEAGENLRQAEAFYRRMYEPGYLGLSDNLRLQSQNLYLQGKFADAENLINTVLKNYQQNSSPKYINYATALTIKGLILNKEGKATEAEDVLREAVKLRNENLPKEHFMSALTTGALGEVLTSQKHYAEAEPLLLESYKNLQTSQATQNPRTELAKHRLAELYTAWGKPDSLAQLR